MHIFARFRSLIRTHMVSICKEGGHGSELRCCGMHTPCTQPNTFTAARNVKNRASKRVILLFDMSLRRGGGGGMNRERKRKREREREMKRIYIYIHACE